MSSALRAPCIRQDLLQQSDAINTGHFIIYSRIYKHVRNVPIRFQYGTQLFNGHTQFKFIDVMAFRINKTTLVRHFAFPRAIIVYLYPPIPKYPVFFSVCTVLIMYKIYGRDSRNLTKSKSYFSPFS